MRLPAQPSSSPAPETPRRPGGTSVAEPMARAALRITPIAACFAILGFAAIAANRHWTGNTEWMQLAWTGVFAIASLGLAGLLAHSAFKAFGRINTVANLVFILAMTLSSAGIVLVKGPAHNYAVAQLSTRWPAAAELLATTDPTGPSANSKPTKAAAKGEPMIHVYRKGGQSAGVQPKGD